MADHRNILVTGGAGYIGTCAVANLLARGKQVTVLDKFLFDSHSLDIFAASPDLHIINGDICDKEVLKAALHGIEAVIHLAAIVGLDACRQDPALTYKTNQDATQALLEVSRENGVNRFLFASTCSIYGRNSGLCTEDTIPLPLSDYGLSKYEAEKSVVASNSEGFKAIALRFATAFGDSYRKRYDLTINEFTKLAAQGRPISVYDADSCRPYLHVKDIAAAICLVLDSADDALRHHIYNVADSGMNFTKREILTMIQRYAAVECTYDECGRDARDYAVSGERIRADLGFSPRMTPESGIAEMVQLISSGQINPDDRKYYNV